MDNRHFTRVAYSELASVKYGDCVAFGDVSDVSLQGAFIKTSMDIPLKVPVLVTLFCSAAAFIVVNADVVHKRDGGVGIRIREVDVHSFVRLRNVIAMFCQDHERIMRETYLMAGCIQ